MNPCGCEVCPLNKTVTRSLQYVVKRVVSAKFFRLDPMMLLLNVWICLTAYMWSMLSRDGEKKFLLKFSQSDNFLCQICCSVAQIAL